MAPILSFCHSIPNPSYMGQNFRISVELLLFQINATERKVRFVSWSRACFVGGM